MQLIDTHAHLDQEEFDADRADVVARAQEAGVANIVSIGVTVASSEATVVLAAELPGVWAAVGIHPNYCGTAAEGDWGRIEELAEGPRVVGLGETGLDFFRDYAPAVTQEDYFDRHLLLSQRTGLPFIVHARASEERVVAMLREAAARAPLRGVMHSFTGDETLMAECVGLGMHISLAGMVTFKKSDSLRRVAASVPADRLLIETDSPYLSPDPLRGKRNEPANVMHTARVVAAARGLSLDELAALTTANARRLFRLAGD